MEIRHLKLIKAIVEEGSIAKAINKLHLTQSALSHQLKEAEQQLGTSIFLRVNKKLVLTQAGEKLYHTAREVLEKLNATEIEIKKMISGDSGEIRLTTECYTSYHWLPSIMRKFHLVFPNVELKIVSQNGIRPFSLLLNDELDLIVTSDPVKNENFEYIELFRDEMVALVHENHEWAAKKYVTAKDFEDQHLIIHSYPLETVTVYQYMLWPAGIMPRKITALPLTEASLEMVKAEMGVLVMAKWTLHPYMLSDSLRTVKLGKNGLIRTHYIATLKNKPHPGHLHAFVDFMKNELKND